MTSCVLWLIICQHWFMLVSRIQLQSNSSNSVLISAKLPLALLKSYLNSCSCSFCFSSHTYNNENTSVPLSFVPGDKCSIPDTMLSSFTSTRPSRLEVCLSLFLVLFCFCFYRLCQKHIPDTFNKLVVLVVGPFIVPSNWRVVKISNNVNLVIIVQ